MKYKLKQKIIFFFSILTCLSLVLGLLVGNIKAFSVGVFDSSNSSFDSSLSSSSASNSKSFYILDDPTCAIASKISVEMEEWPMNYYKNPELASKADIYYKARTSCDEIEYISKKLKLETIDEFQFVCPNTKPLYEKLLTNSDIYTPLIEEYYKQIISCSDQISFIQNINNNYSSTTSNSYDPYKTYTDLEIQQACNRRDFLTKQASDSYEGYMSVSSEYYANGQICTSGTDTFLNSSSSYSYSSSSKKTLTISDIEKTAPYCYDDVATPYPPGCKRCTKNCGYSTTNILDAFCYLSGEQNQISSILGCFIAGIAFITITLSVASFPINAIYILALALNKSKKWKKELWLFGIAFGLIFISTILFAFSAFITSFISPY